MKFFKSAYDDETSAQWSRNLSIGIERFFVDFGLSAIRLKQGRNLGTRYRLAFRYCIAKLGGGAELWWEWG